jgi:hypothetical protein
MFIVAATKGKTITWPVTVEVAADGGRTAKHEFTGEFKLLDDEERKALADEAPTLDADDIGDQTTVTEIDWKEQSVDNILKAMTGWKGVCDESKTPMEFNRDTLLSIARSAHGLSFLRGINKALGEISTGAKAKN